MMGVCDQMAGKLETISALLARTYLMIGLSLPSIRIIANGLARGPIMGPGLSTSKFEASSELEFARLVAGTGYAKAAGTKCRAKASEPVPIKGVE